MGEVQQECSKCSLLAELSRRASAFTKVKPRFGTEGGSNQQEQHISPQQPESRSQRDCPGTVGEEGCRTLGFAGDDPSWLLILFCAVRRHHDVQLAHCLRRGTAHWDNWADCLDMIHLM